MKTIIAIGLVALGLYYYGDVILYYNSSDDECLRFAEKSKVSIATKPDPNNKEIFVAKKWISGGKVVVELGQRVADDKGFQSRLCVVGGGQIALPGLFEQWQYR